MPSACLVLHLAHALHVYACGGGLLDVCVCVCDRGGAAPVSHVQSPSTPASLALLSRYSCVRAVDGIGNIAVDRLRIYLVSLHVSVTCMFGSVGTIAPANFAEMVTMTIMMLFGSMVWCATLPLLPDRSYLAAPTAWATPNASPLYRHSIPRSHSHNTATPLCGYVHPIAMGFARV